MEKRFFRTNYLQDLSTEYATPEQMDKLIRNHPIDRKVSEIFPSANLFNDGKSSIIGSKEFLNAFEEVDCEKLDLVAPLENLTFIEFDDTKEIVLEFENTQFPEHVLKTVGIYEFTNKFLDENFRLKKFAKFCLDREYTDLLNENIEELMKRLSSQTKQYRFLKYEGQWFLRALTSERYKNYDNHLAIYITLVILDSYSLDNDLRLVIGDSYLTDSDIRVNLIEEKTYVVNDDIQVQFGFYTTNNELTEGTFSLQFSYKVFYRKNAQFRALSNYIFDFNHTIAPEKLEKQLKSALTEIASSKKDVIQFIKTIHSENLSENQLYSVFRAIKNSKNKFTQSTKEKAEHIRKESVGNTYSLIELFGRLNEITTDVDETTYLERIYHDVITDFYGRKR